MTSMTSFPGNSVIFVESRASAGRAMAISQGDDCSGRRKDDDYGRFLLVTNWQLTRSGGPAPLASYFVFWCHWVEPTVSSVTASFRNSVMLGQSSALAGLTVSLAEGGGLSSSVKGR